MDVLRVALAALPSLNGERVTYRVSHGVMEKLSGCILPMKTKGKVHTNIVPKTLRYRVTASESVRLVSAAPKK